MPVAPTQTAGVNLDGPAKQIDISSGAVEFYSGGKLIGIIKSSDTEAELIMNTGKVYIAGTCKVAGTIKFGPNETVSLNQTGNVLSTNAAFSAASYQSSDGSVGKTTTEIYKVADGSKHTKIYKDGLLISYQINGIEQ